MKGGRVVSSVLLRDLFAPYDNLTLRVQCFPDYRRCLRGIPRDTMQPFGPLCSSFWELDPHDARGESGCVRPTTLPL